MPKKKICNELLIFFQVKNQAKAFKRWKWVVIKICLMLGDMFSTPLGALSIILNFRSKFLFLTLLGAFPTFWRRFFTITAYGFSPQPRGLEKSHPHKILLILSVLSRNRLFINARLIFQIHFWLIFQLKNANCAPRKRQNHFQKISSARICFQCVSSGNHVKKLGFGDRHFHVLAES